jgi:hypothetical protein
MTQKDPIIVRLCKFQLPISQPLWNRQDTLLTDRRSAQAKRAYETSFQEAGKAIN